MWLWVCVGGMYSWKLWCLYFQARYIYFYMKAINTENAYTHFLGASGKGIYSSLTCWLFILMAVFQTFSILPSTAIISLTLCLVSVLAFSSWSPKLPITSGFHSLLQSWRRRCSNSFIHLIPLLMLSILSQPSLLFFLKVFNFSFATVPPTPISS